MGKGCSTIVVSMLLVMNLDKTRPLLDPCGACTAGTFCGKAANQTCLPCPGNSFSSRGGQKACDICKQCVGIFRTKKQCSKTSDAECECIAGYSCVGAQCARCRRNCEKGQEATPEGCKDCDSGTFYDQELSVCRAWTDCSLTGKAVLVPGSKDKDVVCGPDSAGTSLVTPPTARTASAGAPGHMPQVLVLGLVLLLTFTVVVILVFFMRRLSVVRQCQRKLFYLLKQPFVSPVHASQEEDTCSCRFPEEEEGDCAL